MIFEVIVGYRSADEETIKTRCFVEAGNLSDAAKVGEEAVYKRTRKAAFAINGKSVDLSLVLCRDGEKPYWLSFAEAKEAPGQAKLGIGD